MDEIWKDVPSFEGDYKVSNLGRVMSTIRRAHKILRLTPDKDGYLCFSMRSKKFKVHRVVLWAFAGASDLQVDHLNGEKNDNRLVNLEYVSPRENIRRMKGRGRIIGAGKGRVDGLYRASVNFGGHSYELGHFKTKEDANAAFLSATEEKCLKMRHERINRKSSKYIGVTWVEDQKKWCAKRTFNGKCYNLGSFIDEDDAHDTYVNMTESKAKDLLETRRKSKSSIYEGVSFRSEGRWHARYKDKHIGYFDSELAAYQARCQYLQKF